VECSPLMHQSTDGALLYGHGAKADGVTLTHHHGHADLRCDTCIADRPRFPSFSEPPQHRSHNLGTRKEEDRKEVEGGCQRGGASGRSDHSGHASAFNAITIRILQDSQRVFGTECQGYGTGVGVARRKMENAAGRLCCVESGCMPGMIGPSRSSASLTTSLNLLSVFLLSLSTQGSSRL
jgi:hypothetical protein